MPRCPLCGSDHIVVTLRPLRRGYCFGCDLQWGLDPVRSSHGDDLRAGGDGSHDDELVDVIEVAAQRSDLTGLDLDPGSAITPRLTSGVPSYGAGRASRPGPQLPSANLPDP